MNIREACQEWINGFNAIPQALIEKAYGGGHIDDMYELTKPTKGDYVWSNHLQGAAEIKSIEGDVVILDNNGEDYETTIDEVYLEHDSFLPMWGTMWTFSASPDEWWLEENLDVMSQLGFRIYESDELGYFFGIDGAGYDFLDRHFIPLYLKRGLRWHNEERNMEAR